jgi:hypothetical protein
MIEALIGENATNQLSFNRVAEDSPLELPGPLRVMFMISSMEVGGAEVLLAELVRRMEPCHFLPEICCLKGRGPLGEELAREIPVHHDLLKNKYDLRVWPRLVKILREQRIDAVVTVGAGDKMFWGRLAAKRVGVPVILSALHSTGWPDGMAPARGGSSGWCWATACGLRCSVSPQACWLPSLAGG